MPVAMLAVILEILPPHTKILPTNVYSGTSGVTAATLAALVTMVMTITTVIMVNNSDKVAAGDLSNITTTPNSPTP